MVIKEPLPVAEINGEIVARMTERGREHLVETLKAWAFKIQAGTLGEEYYGFYCQDGALDDRST